MSRSLKAHLLLLFTAFIWGSTFVLVKDALADSSPLLLNATRMSISALVLIVMFFRHLRSMNKDVLKAGAEIGALLYLGYEFQTAGLKLSSASNTAFVTGLSVVLVPLLLFLLWRRHVNRWTWVGAAAATYGLYLLTVPKGGFSWASMNRGDLLTLICAVAFAFQLIVVGRSAQRHPWRQLATVEIAVCALLMLATVPVVERGAFLHWTPKVILALVVTSLLATVAAFVIQAWAQQFTPPSHAALIFSMEPVFAGLTSYVLLRERLGVRGTAGAALILVGVIFSEVLGGVQQPEGELAEETT